MLQSLKISFKERRDNILEEIVGECLACGETVYCRDGFLDGTNENNKLLCPSCSEELLEN